MDSSLLYVDTCLYFITGISIDDLFLAPEYSNKFASEKVRKHIHCLDKFFENNNYMVCYSWLAKYSVSNFGNTA